MADVVLAVLLLTGVVLQLLAGLGLLRFPDAYARLHAGGKASTLGLVLMVLAAALRVRSPGAAATLVLVAVFQLATAPVAAHVAGRAAYRIGVDMAETAGVDELADHEEA